MLGDVLDYWYEYREVVPKGYVRFFGELARLCDSGVEITWFKGNHDIWIFGYLQSELGVKVVDGTIVEQIDGRRFLMDHGDGIPPLKPTFKLIRGVFRNPACQKLFSGIHPRWTIPFAHGWSASSRGAHTAAPVNDLLDPSTDNLIAYARQYLATHQDTPVDYFIFGHKHLLVDYPIGDSDSRLIILGDWITRYSYATWDGENLELRLFNT